MSADDRANSSRLFASEERHAHNNVHGCDNQFSKTTVAKKQK